MTSTPQSRHSHDLGDMFVNAFNSGNYPKSSPSTDNIGPFGLFTSGIDTLASSPEQSGNLNSQTPVSNAGTGTGTGAGGDATGPKLNPRSCVTCRRRKVRCDKLENACSNCVKANIECVYPPPGRAPRKPRRPHDAELLKRLRRLESVVDSLGAQVDDDGHVHSNETGPTKGRSASEDILEVSSQGPSRRTSLEANLGRLMIKDGRSRYISNEFWHTLGEEISEIRNVLDSQSSEEEDDLPSPESNHDLSNKYPHHQGFIFGYSSLALDMSKFHPNPSQIFILWEIYKENVDPVLKITHVPTVKNVIMKAAVSSNELSKASEAVFYAICFASVVSMTEDQCKQLLGEDKDRLMRKYRFAAEQALSRAGFLSSSNLMVLQAFVLFITAVRFIDTTRSVWALCGLALQQAHAQGLHRDGTNFKLGPFETEMRRRLWWHISLQDARASEDYGADPVFHNHFFDTQMPLNFNDDDIWPEMTEAPQEHTGATDMTFCLVRFELAHIQRKLKILTSGETDEAKMRNVKEKEHLIDITHQHMQEKYFIHCDPNSPILWIAATVGKLILAKMWLHVHHPRLYQEDTTQAASDLRDQVFITSIEVVEFGDLLDRGKQTMKWAWLFKTYNQWHAVAYVLSELCHRPQGPDFDRAWNVVDGVYCRRMLDLPKGQRGTLWRPLKQLYARAKKRREMLCSSTSPKSDMDSGKSLSTDSQGQPTPAMALMNDNFLGANPHGNVVSAAGEAFGLDFNDPAFNELSMSNGYDFGAFASGQGSFPQPLRTPLDALPFGWTPEVNDYMGDFIMANAQTGWTPQMQQEWH